MNIQPIIPQLKQNIENKKDNVNLQVRLMQSQWG